MGAANKVSGNKIRKKVLQKINPRKRKTQKNQDLFFIVNHAFSLVRVLFSEDFFCINSFWRQKKVLENILSNLYDFMSSDIFSKDLRKFGLFCKVFISRFFFQKLFFTGLSYIDLTFYCIMAGGRKHGLIFSGGAAWQALLTPLIQKEETLENGNTCTIGFPWTIATNRLVSKIKNLNCNFLFCNFQQNSVLEQKI